ncbi:hypothetical protein KNE206_76840 [Kitasatospora sp. NE20-6]
MMPGTTTHASLVRSANTGGTPAYDVTAPPDLPSPTALMPPDDRGTPPPGRGFAEDQDPASGTPVVI